MATRGWQHVTESELASRTHQAAPKYRNVHVEIDGQTFDSKAEAARWMLLLARARASEIHTLTRQTAFPLYTTDPERRSRICVAHYVADFVYFERDGTRHIEDVKRRATRTAVYQLKRKWLYLQDGIEIEEVG